MTAPLLLDLSHTCHTRARTGIQRVTRALASALGDRAQAVTHDPFRGAWRTLESWERANLTASEAAGRRGARWPWRARMAGRLARWLGGAPATLPTNAGAIVPEIFSPAVGRSLPGLFAASGGPCVALFHDAIALRLPELTPSKTVARFPAYLQELLAFDGVAAVSDDSRAALDDYWSWLGVREHPPVLALPLGLELPLVSDAAPRLDPPVLLSVGSIEGRKNHLALLDACESLWAEGRRFTLRLIGLSHPQTGAAAVARLRALQAAGRPLVYDGPASDATLEQAYAECAFTVYPSLQEGFGLPVIESLARGKPCICSGRGALGESARGGGCVTLDQVDSPSLAAAIRHLLGSASDLGTLAEEARRRTFKTWATYADELTGWMRTLRRTSGRT